MFYLLVMGAGISVALQQVLNANLRMELGSPWWAGFVSYLVGTIFMLAIATMSDQPWLSTAMIARSRGFPGQGGFSVRSSSEPQFSWCLASARQQCSL